MTHARSEGHPLGAGEADCKVPMASGAQQHELLSAIRDNYGRMAVEELSAGGQSTAQVVATAFGYSAAELASIPNGSNMGLSCGNPTAMAGLRSGEVVLDLGCGGGLDVFLAASKVGPTGRAIGVDMTPEMIETARRNAMVLGRPPSNVEFHLATIDRLPFPDAAINVVISNCVINLVPDKAAVFREIHRVLKPGGRLALSDIATKKELPAELVDSLVARIGCIAGAVSIGEYRRLLETSGFNHVIIADSGADLNVYARAADGEGNGATSVRASNGCCSESVAASHPAQQTRSERLLISGTGCCSGPTTSNGIPGPSRSAIFRFTVASVLGRYDLNEYAAGVKVFAVRP